MSCGEGMLCAVERVADKDIRRFFDAGDKTGPRVAAHMLDNARVIARAMPQGDIIGFAPPSCLTKEEADTVVGATKQAMEATLG